VKSMRKAVLEITAGVVILTAGILMIIFVSDFIPRYLGGAIVAAFGIVSITSGVLHLVKK
jgi:hypothetical protein